MSEHAIALHSLIKTYKNFTLGPLELEIPTGTAVGLAGANGSGKSTLFRILMGLIHADSGEVRVLARLMPDRQAEIKQDIAFVSEDMSFHPRADLRWHADLVRSFSPGWDEMRAISLAKRYGLSWEQPLGQLSRGQVLRTMLLLALSRRPRLLLLDEPTAGLDPAMRAQVLAELGRTVHEEGLTLLISSHLPGDLDGLTDQVILLDRGQILQPVGEDQS
jgi:ABC-2 type transport system ATP-binding protein